MRKIIFLISISLLIISCKKKAPITIEQFTSNEMVTITNNKKTQEKDSVDIHFPKEFKIIMNSNNLISINIYNFIDKVTLMNIVDYEISDKKSNKPILTFKPYLSSNDPINIIIKERNHLISKNLAKELLKKYDVKQSLDNLKFGDTIKIIPYSRFRKENNSMINDLRKVDDSIFFRVTSNKGKVFVKGEKINW
ncbi:hypothetical protein IUY40_09355 [Flavobacterium sp. ALJ2]|uniref:hypothetical protein n=1 Tax=Flavobacterium sp. ALJ2 TaxID=2786960 RepID=UPI00189F05DF|nr:hypothetical protein [Flavobacterium sp. ALJ2]MBF7091748.1 hypothetical protein [Flavobacterium sp. ALJ2]